MPSGSKKRKAARKKKENQSLSNHSNGDDDVKQQDDKDSDVGELSSPTSHDHNSHQNNILTEEDEEQNEKGENISHTPSEEALKIKDGEEPSIAEDDVVPVDREFEIEDKSSKKSDGSSSGSSSSRNSSRCNSDDESHRIKKGEAAIDITPVVELESGDGSLSGVPAENIVSAEIDDGVDSVVENFPAEELKNISTLGDKVETDISIAPYISEPTESEEERPGFVEDNGISMVFMDAPLKRKDESIETIVTPDPEKCVTQETHDRVAADVGVELEKDSGVTEVLFVLLLAPAPHPVQTTTWKSCCGLFEVFARSGR
ncbi:uncharacterized protein LOC142522277 isoform X1 [Primulina tabacum]|uniref:uncharacterized protein LOC142522277 isoform X1 n=1 Tax=Primulina tabacum TaxID=48773 RepID=UPI003F59D3F4